MKADLRHKRIIDEINKFDFCEIYDMANLLNVSESTIRNDLNLLEKKGLLIRNHGGAIKKEDKNIVNLTNNSYSNEENKERIVKEAVKLIKENDTVILNSGSTATLLAKEISLINNIKVVTNNLIAAYIISKNSNIILMVTGGTVKHNSFSMHGEAAESSLSGIKGDILFMGADAIDSISGITTFKNDNAISKVMSTVAKKIVCIIDSSKFGKVEANKVLDIQKINYLISDIYVPHEEQIKFKEILNEKFIMV